MRRPLFLPFLALAIRPVLTQAIEDDSLSLDTFTKAPLWSSQRACLKYCFHDGVMTSPVAEQLGCVTVSCLCEPTALYEAIQWVRDCVVDIGQCTNAEAPDNAEALMKEVCARFGYTQVGRNADVVASSSAAAPPTATVTVCPSRADAVQPRRDWWRAGLVGAVGLAVAV